MVKKNIDSWDHPLVGMVQEAMDDFSKMAAPDAWLVDSLPICKCTDSYRPLK